MIAQKLWTDNEISQSQGDLLRVCIYIYICKSVNSIIKSQVCTYKNIQILNFYIQFFKKKK